MADQAIVLNDLNDKFIAAEQFVHKAISNKSKLTKSLWRGMIGAGPFTYGEGYMKRKWSFYGGKALNGAAGDWYQLKDNISDAQAAAGSNSEANEKELDGADRAVEDAALAGTHRGQYNPQLVGYGFESKEYTLYETTRRTEDVNLRNLLFKWQFKQQMKLILDGLADITLGEWEKWLRETYVSFATKRVVMEGMNMAEFTITGAVQAGGIVNNAGLRQINLPTGVLPEDIGRLTQDVLDYQYQYLSRQAVGGKSADGENGMPVFTLVTSFETSTEIIRKDTERNRRMDYALPSFHLKGYGTVKGYQNWAHYHDIETPRYNQGATAGVLERVYPYETTPTNIGDAVNISMQYVTAPYELSIVFLKEVYRGLVPENPMNVDKATFDGASNMGTFKWINIKNRTNNLLGEIGFMFARFNCAPEPLDQVDNAICLLHRRDQVVPITLPATSWDETTVTATAISMAARVVQESDTSDVLYDEVEVILAEPIKTQLGDSVQVASTAVNAINVTGAITGAKTAVVTRDYTNGRLQLKFGGKADWITAIEAGATTVDPDAV